MKTDAFCPIPKALRLFEPMKPDSSSPHFWGQNPLQQIPEPKPSQMVLEPALSEPSENQTSAIILFKSLDFAWRFNVYTMNNHFNDTRNMFIGHIFSHRIRICLWSTFVFYFPIPSRKLSCVFNSLSFFLGCSLSFSTESGATTLSKEKYFQSLRNYSPI